MLDEKTMALLTQIAAGIVGQFGEDCEVAVHDLTEKIAKNSIVHIENGHVTHQRAGTSVPPTLLSQLEQGGAAPDRIGYLTRTSSGKILKSTSMYIKDGSGAVAAILSINFDITRLNLLSSSLNSLTSPLEKPKNDPITTPSSVNGLLDELICEATELVGKPVELMDKEDKVRAIRFLSEAGAFLITRSGDRVSKYFGISKYTLYSYIDAKTGGRGK